MVKGKEKGDGKYVIFQVYIGSCYSIGLVYSHFKLPEVQLLTVLFFSFSRPARVRPDLIASEVGSSRPKLRALILYQNSALTMQLTKDIQKGSEYWAIKCPLFR